MNLSDVLLHLVDKLIAEKEQNFILKQQISQQNQQVSNEQKDTH